MDPIWKKLPGLCEAIKVEPHTSESDGGSQVTLVPHEDAGAETVISVGQLENTRAELSSTMTLNLHEEEFPLLSVAV
jgi:hypothetical protein